MTDIYQFYENLSTKLLLAQHGGIKSAYESDSSMASDEQQNAQSFSSDASYYGVGEFADWKEHGRAIEKALSKRKQYFIPIEFEKTVRNTSEPGI